MTLIAKTRVHKYRIMVLATLELSWTLTSMNSSCFTIRNAGRHCYIKVHQCLQQLVSVSDPEAQGPVIFVVNDPDKPVELPAKSLHQHNRVLKRSKAALR